MVCYAVKFGDIASTMYYLLLYVIIYVAMIVVTNATNNLHVYVGVL